MKPNIRPLTGHGLKQALPTSLRTLVVLFAMLLSTTGAWADEVDVSTLTGAYEAPNGTTLTGTLSKRYKITIAAGATVTLKDLTIRGITKDEWTNQINSQYPFAGLTCAGNATIILEGTNSVIGFGSEYPGIQISEGYTLNIQGSGSLEVNGGCEIRGSHAAIGSPWNKKCGNINITGGTIVAHAGIYTGIGSPNMQCGTINITTGINSLTVDHIYSNTGGLQYYFGSTNFDCADATTLNIFGTSHKASEFQYKYNGTSPLTFQAYGVDFYTNATEGVSGSMSQQRFGYSYEGAKALTANAYARAGYTFKEWDTAPDGSGTSYTDGQSVEDLTDVAGGVISLYAQWTANQYNVVFDANGGEGTMSNQQLTYDAAATALTTNTFTRTGYTFAGWNTASDGSGTSYANGAEVQNLSTGADITLYAQWTAHTYTITFNANSGEGTVPDAMNFIYGVAQNLPSDPLTLGYNNAVGWNTAADGTGTSYALGAEVSNLTAEDGAEITLYAQWPTLTSSWTSGDCSIRLWTDGTMIFSGTGAMPNYSVGCAPWYSSRQYVTKVVIESGVTSIGEGAFMNYDNLASVTIPNSVTSIGEEAFAICTSLASITIPNSVTNIGKGAFAKCTSLASITVEEGNTKYDSRSNCNAIIEKETNTLIIGCKTTIIPRSVTSIGEGAFIYCADLVTIDIPNSVTSIGYRAFFECNNLASVICWGTTVPSLGQGALYCATLHTVYVLSDVVDDYKNASGWSELSDIIKANTMTSGDFYYNLTYELYASGLLRISGNGEMIDPWLSSRESVTKVVIENGVTSIGSNAFNYCTNLVSIDIPHSVTSIGDYAFHDCNSLRCVTCWAVSVPTLSPDVFANNVSGRIIYVLPDLVDTYKAATNWSEYADYIEAIDYPTAVATNAVTGTFEGNWCTYYNSNANVQVDDNTTIYTISEASGSTATLHKVSGKIIKAGEGVILKSTGSSITLTYTSAAATADDYTGNLLEGVDVITRISTSDYHDKYIYTLANESGLGFYLYHSPDYADNVSLGANKAILALDAEVAARGLVFQYEETTGIRPTPLPLSYREGSSYYNLNGQRIGKPNKAGLYIVNGKKVAIK